MFSDIRYLAVFDNMVVSTFELSEDIAITCRLFVCACMQLLLLVCCETVTGTGSKFTAFVSVQRMYIQSGVATMQGRIQEPQINRSKTDRVNVPDLRLWYC